MPANPRQAVKQTLATVSNEVERAGQKLIGLLDLYTEQYPEHHDALIMLATTLADIQKAVQAFSDAV